MAAITDDTQLTAVYGDHEVHVTGIVIGTVCAVAAIVVVVLRFWSRRMTEASVGWDDRLIALALVACLTHYGFSIWWISLRDSRNVGDVTTDELRKVSIVLFANLLSFAVSVFLVRASALILWTRIFVGPRVRAYCWFWSIFNIIWVVTWIIVQCLQCRPLPVFFEPLNPAFETSCHLDTKKWWITGAASGILVDLATITLPLVICVQLHLNRTMKIALIALVSTGLFATICSAVRLYYLLDEVYRPGLLGPAALKLMWMYTKLGTWNGIEMLVSVVAACLPCLKPVIAKVVPASWVPKAMRKKASVPQNSLGQLRGDTLPGNASSHPKDSNDGETQSLTALSPGISGNRITSADEESGHFQVTTAPSGEAVWDQRPTVMQMHSGRDVSRDQLPQRGIVVEKSFQVHVEKK